MDKRRAAAPAHFTFISSNRAWGGSEELWAAAAACLRADGHRIDVYKSGLPRHHPRVAALRRLGCRVADLALPMPGGRRFAPLAGLRSSRLAMVYEAAWLWLYLLLRRKPDLAIVSQGGNHDGWPMAAICRSRRIPYVCICHKASDGHWPPDRWRDPVRMAFAAARGSFFVAEHTLRLTEEQIGMAVANASLVRNPFNVAWDRPQPWPSTEKGIRLGCVGRLNVAEKGQDILLRVLAMEKWRARPVSVTFLGAGDQRQGLEAMGAWLGLSSVRFAGLSDDIEAFWRDHHALLLPSRAEGLPLVIVEALLSGRIAIVTNVGGNAELLEEGSTAFIADAATDKALDDAMERAWARRDEWAALGTASAVSARSMVRPDPARDFADRLLEIAGGGTVRAMRGPTGIDTASDCGDVLAVRRGR